MNASEEIVAKKGEEMEAFNLNEHGISFLIKIVKQSYSFALSIK